MTDVNATITELLELEAEMKEKKRRVAELRAELATAMRSELAERGVAPSWRVKGAGTVTLVVPDPQLTIVDEAKFAEAVAADNPEWLVLRVDPLHAEGILRTCAEDGELFAGVEMVERLPYVRVTPERRP